MRRIFVIWLALLLVTCAAMMGCGTDTSVAGTAFQRLITGLVVAPKLSSKGVGNSQQFTATASANDGSSGDATSLVTWTSSDPAIASIGTNTGLATGLKPGTVTITASAAGFSDTASLTITGLAGNAAAIGSAGTALLRFDIASPASVTSQAFTGLSANDVMVGLDRRPQNHFLYGLGFNSAAGTVRLYLVNPDTAQCNPLGTDISFTTDGTTAAPITGTGFGFDFNPSVDRIRVTTNTGQNFRIDPNTGAGIDGNLGGGALAGINMDGPITGATGVDGVAYTNNVPNNGGITTLYALDSVTNNLFIQNPANSGTETNPQGVTLNGNPLDFTASNGFDIPVGVNAAASNAAVASGSGFAALSVGGSTGLYSLNLVNGQATLVGPIGSGADLRGFTLLNDNTVNAIASVPGSLQRFVPAIPGTITTQAISGLDAAEAQVGLDYRPATGQLFALGINAAADTATLYRVDPQTGSFTVIGSAGQIAFVDAGGNPIDLPDTATSGYGFDFNPTADRIRITTSTGLNFRVNPDTGAAVDGDPATAGVNPDGAINGSGVTGVADVAYTNSLLGATVTTLYTLDPTGNRLLIQNPPNAGTQTLPLTVTQAGVPLDFTSINGFDIASTVKVSTSNAAASGNGIAALTVGGVTGIYTIDLLTGAATFGGTLGAGGTPVTGMTLGN